MFEEHQCNAINSGPNHLYTLLHVQKKKEKESESEHPKQPKLAKLSQPNGVSLKQD